jgi:glycosyltransferase involved in cell wall biosynthesis
VVADQVVLDARWWGKGGTGTFTAALLEGLAECQPANWAIWGPSQMADRVWPGASFVATEDDPASAFGQRSLGRVPAAGLVFHPHQTRPFHRYPAASCVLDLIQLEHRSQLVRPAMAARLDRTVAAAAALFTISQQVRSQLVERYGSVGQDVTVLHLPVDRRFADRVATARSRTAERSRRLLMVGRFAPHKNHAGLVDAFGRSRFAAEGGELHLVGGTARELQSLGVADTPGVVVRGVLTDEELEAEFATALALVQPSLSEGHGLPVSEALFAGLPVLSSPVPAAVEHGPASIPLLDPTDCLQMAAALDAVVDQIDGGRYWEQVDREAWLQRQATPATLAAQILTVLDRKGLPSPHGGAGHTRRGRLQVDRGISRRDSSH